MTLPNERPQDQARAGGTYLTGVRIKPTEGKDYRGGVSWDQIAAGELGKDTQLRSLEVGLFGDVTKSTCDTGWSCVYNDTLCWSTNRSAAMVDRLLKAGANPNAASNWTGETALMRCAFTGNLEAVKSLLAHGADVKAKDIRQGHTALMWALSQKHVDVARAFIVRGADVNERAKSGFTPLMFAAQQGDTALLIASLSGYEKLSVYLLDKGANPNAADENGFTALHFAMLKGVALITRVQPHSYTPFLNRPNMTELIKALLAHKGDPNAQIKTENAGDKFYKAEPGPYRPYEPTPGTISPVGATPFLIAAMTYDTDLMRMLVAAGADPKLATADNVTPLMAASDLGRARGSNINAADQKKAMDAVKLALELGNDVNAADKTTGLTALHGATYSGTNPLIKFLVENGAKVDAKDKSGQTPEAVALIGQTANGGAGNIHPGQRWISTSDLLLTLGATPIAAPLPEGPGKAAFVKVCSGCHELQRAATLRLSPAEWTVKVKNMAKYGATMTDDDVLTIVRYLGTHFASEEAAAESISRSGTYRPVQ
jgi:ankyrin repeat protein